tara:strand:- start:302 stop:823 length:522 start_codon:yes stop_codon:yes gene_type:complete
MEIDYIQFLNAFDIIFIIIVLISFLFGVKNGFIKSLFNVIKWTLIFYLIKNCFTILRPLFDLYVTNQTISDILIFFSTLIVSYILISFVNRIVIGIVQPKKSLFIDITFGGILGILRGYIVFVLLIFFINSNFSSQLIPNFIKEGTFQEIVNFGIGLLEQAPRNINDIKNLDI